MGLTPVKAAHEGTRGIAPLELVQSTLDLGPLHVHLCRPGLDGRPQRVVSQVRITHCARVVRMPEHLAYREQVDAGVDHERGRRVTQIVDA